MMSISYDNLWQVLKEQNMNKTDLKDLAGISFNVLARMGKCEPVSIESIEKICAVLNCNIEDVIRFVPEPEQISNAVPRSIELFAGAGGLALGLEKAGFHSLGLIEVDTHASKTLKLNRPDWNVIQDDIANISSLNLETFFHIKKGELDLLSGGAPCQAFSYAGKRLGLEDEIGRAHV